MIKLIMVAALASMWGAFIILMVQKIWRFDKPAIEKVAKRLMFIAGSIVLGSIILSTSVYIF